MDVDPAINVWLEKDGVEQHLEIRALRGQRYPRWVWVDAHGVRGDIEVLTYADALALRARLDQQIAELLDDGWLPTY
jgi:hypothetical protein